jgi:hypothetical protein
MYKVLFEGTVLYSRKRPVSTRVSHALLLNGVPVNRHVIHVTGQFMGRVVTGRLTSRGPKLPFLPVPCQQ